MVVAEVPLWVIHSDVDKELAQEEGHKARAQESLSFLETLGGGSKKVAIYSVDIHPNGTKFATGGGDGKVRLWSIAALFARFRGTYAESSNKYESSDSSSGGEDMEVDESNKIIQKSSQSAASVAVHDLNQLRRKKGEAKPSVDSTPAAKSPPSQRKKNSSNDRLLCTLSAHTGSSVLAVRFSTAGQYLASAGDDAVVCIYAPTSTMVSNLSENIEQWVRIKLCRGHTLDVVGLAWAPDDSHLVTCSLDSDAPIIVWKLTDIGSVERATPSNVLCNPYKILGKGIHTSTVKGVTFDPAGSYIASSGDDPAVCIWRAHDDWGLEKRIGSDSGIFRKWKDTQELSSQTLFRRLSWATDGTYICSTNSSIKNKHVASTISRDGWSVSSSKEASTGAANLVGHKQPVVVSRHCPFLMDARKPDENGEHNGDPEYALLIALGDKRGFVSVWSTKKSRPLFKLQCSEGRCTVTDLAWGKTSGGAMVLLVSLLDGQIVALRFAIPDELGKPLSDDDQKKVFQLRYGIDLEDDTGLGGRRVFVGDRSGPKLIENALQFALEDQVQGDNTTNSNNAMSSDDENDVPLSSLINSSSVKSQQTETQSKSGKKRIRPVLMSAESSIKAPAQNGVAQPRKREKTSDTVQDAVDAASKVATAAEDIAASSMTQTGHGDTRKEEQTDQPQGPLHQRERALPTLQTANVAQIPHSTNRTHSIDLPMLSATLNAVQTVADCTNYTRTSRGTPPQTLPSCTVSISHGGRVKWRDDIIGTSCTSLSATTTLLAVGTADGTVYVYGTSSTTGWSIGIAFRSHAPLVFGHAVVVVQMKEIQKSDDEGENNVEMLVVVADGSFGVYRLSPQTKLLHKGTVLSAMNHMVLATPTSQEMALPRLSRIQITDSGYILMILSQQASQNANGSNFPVGVGGSMQAFVYNKELELWMRVSDGRFVLSDFFTALPPLNNNTRSTLSRIDDTIRSGARSSSAKAFKRSKTPTEGHAKHMYSETENESMITRSHCEDRLACAMALRSSCDFQFWLKQYICTLAMNGTEAQLRFVFDLLLGTLDSSKSVSECWWLSTAPSVLGLDRINLVKTVVIPEMSKNRVLQRLTNEFALELETMGQQAKH